MIFFLRHFYFRCLWSQKKPHLTFTARAPHVWLCLWGKVVQPHVLWDTPVRELSFTWSLCCLRFSGVLKHYKMVPFLTPCGLTCVIVLIVCIENLCQSLNCGWLPNIDKTTKTLDTHSEHSVQHWLTLISTTMRSDQWVSDGLFFLPEFLRWGVGPTVLTVTLNVFGESEDLQKTLWRITWWCSISS